MYVYTLSKHALGRNGKQTVGIQLYYIGILYTQNINTLLAPKETDALLNGLPITRIGTYSVRRMEEKMN